MTENDNAEIVVNPELFGRRTIYTSLETLDGLSDAEIVAELNTALAFHNLNLLEEDYLYWYRRGITPILARKKERNSFVNNRIQENHAEEIVSFKNGYFLTQPAFYISRKKDDETISRVAELNEYLYKSGKTQADNEVADWFHTVGKGVIFVKPVDDEETPVKVYSVDPRCAFVVYSLKPGNEPVYAVNAVTVGQKIRFDLITPNVIYRLSGGVTSTTMTREGFSIGTAITVDERIPNPLGLINIVEYQYNSTNMGAFETVLPLLNALDTVASNRVDGIEQFIQSLVVIYNAQLPEGEDANTLRQKGLLLLNSQGEIRSDIKILSEQLDQTQTQTLVDYMYQQILTICGMPSTTKGGSSTSDTGAAVLFRDGWYQADTYARNTEDLFKKSNRYFDRIFLKILRKKVGLELSVSDFELNITRNETANIQSKAQACQTLLASGLAPELAFAKSGISNDPVKDVELSTEYLQLIWGDPAKVKEGKGEAVIIEEDRDTGINDTGGAV